MDYATFAPMLDGFEWALLKGLMYGLVAVFTLWAAGTLVERRIKRRDRSAIAARPRANSSTEERDPLSHRATTESAEAERYGAQASAEGALPPLRRSLGPFRRSYRRRAGSAGERRASK